MDILNRSLFKLKDLSLFTAFLEKKATKRETQKRNNTLIGMQAHFPSPQILWLEQGEHKPVGAFSQLGELCLLRCKCGPRPLDSLYSQLRTILKVKILVAQSCPSLCDPLDCNPPGSSVHEILQIRTLEWVAISSSKGSSWPRDQTQVSHIADGFFTLWTIRDALDSIIYVQIVQGLQRKTMTQGNLRKHNSKFFGKGNI